MHGGSGVDKKQTQDAISNGISKVNYYTYMSTAVAPKLVDMINNSKDRVFFHDISLYATQVMKELCKETIKIFMNKQ
jgi:fructose-bisphosphate aldolase class II